MFNRLLKFSAAIFFAALAVSCNKEPGEQNGPESDVLSSIVATAGNVSVKSSLDNPTSSNPSVCWNADDIIRVFSKTAGRQGERFTTTSEDLSSDKCSATFKGSIAAPGPYCAVYPTNAVSTGSCEQLALSIPAQQNYCANSFPKGSNIAVACWPSGNKAEFKSLMGAVRIPLKGTAKVGKIVLEDKDANSLLWGSCTVDCNSGTGDCSISAFQNGSNTLTLVCNPNVQLRENEDTYFYMNVPAGSFAGGLKLSVYDSSEKEIMCLSTKENLSIERGCIKTVSDLDTDSPFSKGTGTESDPYIISSAAELAGLSDMVNGRHDTFAQLWYRQSCDIDMSGVSYKPSGLSDKLPFTGHYDGGGFKISNLSVTISDAKAGGLFGYLSAAEIKGVNLVSYTCANAPTNTAPVASYCSNSSISDCHVSGSELSYTKKCCGGVVGYITDGTVVENCSFSNGSINVKIGSSSTLCENGGVVGYIKGGIVKGCTFSGSIRSDGQRIGGIAAAMFGADSKILDCTVTSDAVIRSGGNEAGGIVGIVAEGSEIDGCTMNGRVLNEIQRTGGIVATLREGTVRNCVVGPEAKVSAIDTQAGGIAGATYCSDAKTSITIDNCLVCATVQGKARVGGIVGYYTSGNKSGDTVNITNCGFDGGTLIATGNLADGSDFVAGIGGILGSCAFSTYDETVNIINCWASPAMMRLRPNQVPYGSEAIDHTTSPRVGGIIGDQSGDNSHCTIAGCYSDMAKFQIDFNGGEWPDTPSKDYGGLYGTSSSSIKYDKDYCTVSIQYGPDYSKIKSFDCEQLGQISVTDGTLLQKMNTFVSTYSTSGIQLKNWVRGPEGHPVLEGMNVPFGSKKGAPLRISVIGDSISTFIGWLPDGYHRYFPATAESSLVGGMSLTKVSQTYWWRLAYDFMSNAVIDKNISWSGSLVSALKEKHFAEGGGSTNLHYYGRSFVERFIQQDGMGNPDIILIKGGTNDGSKAYYKDNAWTGDKFALYLAGNVKNRSTEMPGASLMAPLYAAGDAAKTYEQAKALGDDTFAESYIKLIRLCQTKYPNVKIVCIVSDSIFKGMADTAIDIAKHYGCKTIDLYRLDGKTAIYKNNIDMPKVDATDLSKNGNGCHPDPRGMEFVARKIYTELGAWLEGDPYTDAGANAGNDDFTTVDGQWR